MYLYEYQRSRSLRFTFSNFFSLEPLHRLKPNFMWSLHRMGEWKFVQMVQVTWPVWLWCPYMVKTLKHHLWNPTADDLESWYAASFTQVLPSLFKWWPWVDVDLFNGKVKFGPLCFCMGKKGKIMDFSETIVVYHIKVGRFSQLNEYMNLYEYQGSRSSIDLHPGSLQIQHFQTSFAQKLLGRSKPNFIWSLHGMWGMKICSSVPGHMTMPIYGEKLQKSSSEPRGRWPWNLVYSIGYSSTTSVFIWWPWVDLDHFYDRIKFVSECFCMGEGLYSIES